MLVRLLPLLLLAWGTSPAPLPGTATREVLTASNQRYLEAAGVTLEGGAPLASLESPTAQACAQACLDSGPKCGWFSAECRAGQASDWGGGMRVPPPAGLAHLQPLGSMAIRPCLLPAGLPLQFVHSQLHAGAARER